MNGSASTDSQPLEMYRDLVSGKGPLAHVSMTVGIAKEYGALKVQASVNLACDQNEKTLNRAGEYAFLKAIELVEDGWEILEARIAKAAELRQG